MQQDRNRGLLRISVLLSAKNQPCDHGQMSKISVSPRISSPFSDRFQVLTTIQAPKVWEVRVAEKQNDGISGSMG